jgi:hypothetical protein
MVLDFAPVCEVAAEFIAHYGLQPTFRIARFIFMNIYV